MDNDKFGETMTLLVGALMVNKICLFFLLAGGLATFGAVLLQLIRLAG